MSLAGPVEVVLDAMLPKRSGFLVLEKLKGPDKKKGQKPYIIMITGNEGKRHRTWAGLPASFKTCHNMATPVVPSTS